MAAEILIPYSKIRNTIQPKKLPTILIFIFLGFSWFLNELVLAWVHDQVPRNAEPLPDLWFRWLPEIPMAMKITEYLMIFLLLNALFIIFLHQHRWIVARRVFFCVAFCYFCRACCITILQVPVPSNNTYCAPKAVNNSFSIIIERITRTFWSAGIEQLRSRELCGDLIVSGHTLTIMIAVMTFRQYAPKQLNFLDSFYQILAYIALISILMARKHYSIDVVLGYCLATRTFWTYHSLQYSFHQGEWETNTLNRTIWANCVRLLEADAPPPNQFINSLNWPSSCPKKIRRKFFHKII